MYPILFSYGPFHIYTYGFFLALAFICSMYMAGREAKRRGERPEQIYDLSFYCILAAIVGSRIFDVILKWDYFAAHPLEIFMLWKGGLAFQGGLILGLATMLFYIYRHQMPLWTTMDIMALATPLGQFIGRLGCFMAGCCFGRECHLPWAVTFTNPDTLATSGGACSSYPALRILFSSGSICFPVMVAPPANLPRTDVGSISAAGRGHALYCRVLPGR